jgi:hypothetical protein
MYSCQHECKLQNLTLRLRGYIGLFLSVRVINVEFLNSLWLSSPIERTPGRRASVYLASSRSPLGWNSIRNSRFKLGICAIYWDNEI